MNVANLLRSASRSFPDHIAVSCGDFRMTYSEFDRASAAFADYLRSIQAAPSGRVVLFLDNCPELLVAMLGTFRAGATIVPCNSRLTRDELEFIVTDCNVRLIIADPAHEAVAKSAADNAGAEVLVVGPAFNSIVSTEPSSLVPAEVAGTDTAWIFYTSGTTGRPKGAMLSHECLNFVTVSWLADLTPLTEHDVTLHAAPLSHGAGFHALAAIARATHQVIPATTSFDPASIAALINDQGVTNTWMVPTQIVMLTNSLTAEVSMPTLQYVVYGGAPMTPASMTRALERFGPIFVQLFGQGETPMTATVLRRDEHVPGMLGSAGRPRPGIEVAVLSEDGSVLPDGEIGEVAVRGLSVMTGYWNRPEATAETIKNGWLHTGDLGRFMSGNVLFLLDRAKDMIISGGSNVYAVEVEKVLTTHVSVGEVAVVGAPDDVWGEVVVAVIVPAVGATVEVSALEGHCRETLAGYKIPRRYEVVDSLPRNAYGKVLKRELRERLAANGRK